MSELYLSPDELIEKAIERGEGIVANNGALRVETGKRTGRSPNDRFIVRDNETADQVDWGNINRPVEPEVFEKLWNKAQDYIGQRPESFATNVHVGAHEDEYLPMHVQSELAWHNLFAQTLFITPKEYNPKAKRTWSILSCPNMHADPAVDGTNSEGAVMLDFTNKRILIVGIHYAGEMKKAAFSALNFRLPTKNILPMHCSANINDQGKVTIFFGLSGTGKTTLSADPHCDLIGDDEHGWTDGSVFNFEGGCYAKCINLTQENEPVIWNSLKRGSVLENVILVDGEPDFSDSTLTENTRATYPRHHIEKVAESNNGPEPSSIIFLTCDLNGVLPPVSKLSPKAAAYHFLSGYTAAMAGTELGAAVKPTFSACFGAPFFPRQPRVYAELLIERLNRAHVPVYLVNTGWTGGAYGTGDRFPIKVTRAVVAAIQSGAIEQQDFQHLPELNVDIPTSLPGVDSSYLNPSQNWQDKDAYTQELNKLIGLFHDNFDKFDVGADIAQAGPKQA